jgi:hypothetical protein
MLNDFRRVCDNAGLHRQDQQPEELEKETLKSLDFDRRPRATTRWSFDKPVTRASVKNLSGNEVLMNNVNSWQAGKPFKKIK